MPNPLKTIGEIGTDFAQAQKAEKKQSKWKGRTYVAVKQDRQGNTSCRLVKLNVFERFLRRTFGLFKDTHLSRVTSLLEGNVKAIQWDDDSRNIVFRINRAWNNKYHFKTHFPAALREQAKNDQGRTLLHQACRKGDVEQIRQLLAEDLSSIDEADSEGCTPLYLACSADDFNAVKVLVENGADVHRPSQMPSHLYEHSPLEFALRSTSPNSEDIICLLLEHGADPNVKMVNSEHLIS